MTRLTLSLFCVLFASAAVAQQAPLIDRELFFGDPEISQAQLSPDGKYITFMKPLDKTRNIWIKGVSEPFSAARPITAETKRPIPGYFWSRDSKLVLYVQDNQGDENFNVWSVDPAAKPAEGARTPAARNLTDLKGIRAMIYSRPRTDPSVIYVGLNDRDKAWHDLYKLNIVTGERTLLRKNTDRVVGWIFDNSGNLRLAQRVADNGDNEILRLDPDKATKIYSCTVLESCGPSRFHQDGKRVYMETNAGSIDLLELALLDPQTGKVEKVESDPLNKVDFANPIFSELSDELVGTVYVDEKPRIYWRNKAYEADYKLLKSRLGADKEVNVTSQTADERMWIVGVRSDVEPGETYLFNRTTKKLELQYKIREKLPRAALAKMEPIRYESSDGLEIPGYLTLPKGVAPKNLPVLIIPHGGPWGRDNWGFSSFAQFWANRGYAVLQPNFRASVGYGKRFLDKGNRQWGNTMQDDITWGAKHLIAKGIADPKRIGIMGGSYGGYATLAGVAFTPDLYSAAVAIVAPSNLITLLESIPPYWEAVRKQFYQRMGDLESPEGRKQLERQSPLNSASKIKTPLMVVQGANDPRVNKAESDQIVIALRDRNFPVEYLVAPDEGHGFARPVNNLAMMYAAENFLAKHLGGRAQTDATPEVSARLKEITVDPATVKLAKKANTASVGAPVPARTLAPGAAQYAVKVQMGDRTMDMTMSSKVEQSGDDWVVTDSMQTPGGEAVDTATLDRKTLQVKRRAIKQGPLAIEFQVSGQKANGSAKMGESARPMDVDLGGPLFADNAGSLQSIAALPLAAGYETTYRNIDLMKMKPKLLALKVAGSETVTVPAGSFAAWRVEITSAESGPDKVTVWVSKESPKAVKLESVLPQGNGAKLIAELK